MKMKLTLLNKPAFETFVRPGEIIEVRILNAYGKSPAWGNEWAKGTVSGYFDDHESFCRAVIAADKALHGGIYFTLQIIDPRLIGRAFNRLKPSNVATSDQNVSAYRWLPVDVDPVRPSGISASETELKEALCLRDDVAAWVVDNFEFTPPIKAVSGNGGHLLFRLPDLPANDKTKSFIKHMLEMLAEKFNTEKVTIDTSVFNPARIWKLYGTTCRKGDAVPAGPAREARPHRLAFIDHAPEIQAVSRDTLNKTFKKVMPEKTPPKETRPRGNHDGDARLDVSLYLDHYGIPYRTKNKNGATFYCLDQCVFDSSHAGNDSAIIQTVDGVLLYQCFHGSCRDKRWKDARQVISGGDNLFTFLNGVKSDECIYQ